MAGSRNITQLPYSRNAPPAMSPVDHEPPSDAAEPTIKKKHKRANARQLEVLNATRIPFHRRAYCPSEAVRYVYAECANSNKRQAMRQGRRATTSTSNLTSNPSPTPTPPVAGYHRASPALMSPRVQQSGPAYTSRSSPPMVRTGQIPSPPSGRNRANIDRRTLDLVVDIKPYRACQRSGTGITEHSLLSVFTENLLRSLTGNSAKIILIDTMDIHSRQMINDSAQIMTLAAHFITSCNYFAPSPPKAGERRERGKSGRR
ncbi:hypothetical protein EDB85DRAFT_1898369 [Lactarius pseudohatsudake]|nr:hypothetical protein EDB85DRAFT_1898369 [Lactarius pseudohatsudake]